ncbi:hypothetical protein JIN77_10255 [Verrucomicrobiaceae bacterium R5-34]|nr:hypothetical protein [Verrucomicrobiaceae bacterium R5-34]
MTARATTSLQAFASRTKVQPRRGLLSGALSACLTVLLSAGLIEPLGAVESEKADATGVVIRIDSSKTTRRIEVNPTGYCMSFLNDDATGPDIKPFAGVFKSMRTGSLRFPMGTLAENYLFHDLRLGAPKEGALQPRVITKKKYPGPWSWAVNPDGSYKAETLDFDEFITMCRASNTEPVVLVSSHGHLFPGAEFTEEDILRNAEEWVRYANVTRKLGIKYWEIGNEVDLPQLRKLMPKEQYLKLYQKMATRMKKVDPSIRVGLGTFSGKAYATEALAQFPELVDFVVVHHYMGWMKTYEDYLNSTGSFMKDSAKVLSIIDKVAPDDRKQSTEILITEFSSFCAGVKDVPADREKNSITSAMITFEMLATGVAMDDRVRFLHFWVTHNPWGKNNPTDYANAFAPDNSILPQGRAIEIMGRFLQDRMVAVDCPDGPIRCWASSSKDSSKLAIWVVNRTQQAQETTLNIPGFQATDQLSSWSFAGKSPYDEQPTWGAGKDVKVRDGSVTATLPPLSITVFHNITPDHSSQGE